jgi:Ankyrin repeats (3 copies)
MLWCQCSWLAEHSLRFLCSTAPSSDPRLTDYTASIDSLLDAGADINACFMDAADGVELSLLMCACQYYTSEPMAILLHRGADACLQTPSVSLTALHIAARCGSTDKCKLLLEANRRAIELRSCDGKSPLFEAAWGRNFLW